MKRLLFQLIFAAAAGSVSANSMLQNPSTGTLNTLNFQKLCIASNGTDAVLLATDNTAIYAIDIADNAAGEAASNTITSIPDFVTAKLVPLAGQNVVVTDMAVNPISKAVYIVAINNTATSSFLFRVKDNGASVSLVNLSNVKHSKISWGGPAYIMDVEWGNGTLYASSGWGLSSLDGELGWIKPPFAHNSSVTKRATTMFKSNWGNQYVTDAPLETLALGSIGGKTRLMGVTTCAPGFSLDIAGLSGTGLMQVTEDFNVNSGMSFNVVFQSHDGGNWLFDLHEGLTGRELYRIGEKYINGSPVTGGKYNANAIALRDINMNRTSGLTDADLKLFPGNYHAICFWDNYRLLVLESGNGALKMLQTAASAPPTGIAGTVSQEGRLTVYPNPSAGTITIGLPGRSIESSMVTIYDAVGKIVWNQYVTGSNFTLKMDAVNKGNYTVSVTAADGSARFASFFIQ